MHELEQDGDTVRVAVDTDHLDEVVRVLAAAGVRALQAHPPTLEELFLRHYEGQRDGRQAGPPA